MNKKLQIIGLSGTNGSGKDTVGHILAEHHNCMFISVTELLREECRKRGLPVAREHLRAISADWRREHGLGVLVDRAVEAFEQAGGTGKFTGVVMASLRNPYEADRIHELGGTMVWVDADPEVRYQRVTGSDRGRGTEDQRTFEQFLADEAAEMHPPKDADQAALNMAAVRDRADLTIKNNTSNPETLRRDVEAMLEQFAG